MLKNGVSGSHKYATTVKQEAAVDLLNANGPDSRVCVLLGGVWREEGPAVGLQGDEEAEEDGLLWGVDVSRRCGGSSN